MTVEEMYLKSLLNRLREITREGNEILENVIRALNQWAGIYDHDCHLVGGHGEDSCDHSIHGLQKS